MAASANGGLPFKAGTTSGLSDDELEACFAKAGEIARSFRFTDAAPGTADHPQVPSGTVLQPDFPVRSVWTTVLSKSQEFLVQARNRGPATGYDLSVMVPALMSLPAGGGTVTRSGPTPAGLPVDYAVPVATSSRSTAFPARGPPISSSSRRPVTGITSFRSSRRTQMTCAIGSP